MHRDWSFIILPFLCSFVILGCGGNQDTHSISGTVTFDGQPITNGNIVFEPIDGASNARGGKIENGKFSLDSTAGKMRIRITAVRETGEIRKGALGENIPLTVSYIPPRYNTETVLIEEVGPQGKTEFDFPLTSQ